MEKQIIYSQACREKLLEGARLVGNTIRTTLGPVGRNCLLEQKEGAPPLVTDDGVTIAKAIHSEDPEVEMGVRMIREAAMKTNDLAGDGTTTATILAQAMLERACLNIAAGANPIELRKGMQMAGQMAVACIGKMTTPVQGKEDVIRIASISSKDDKIGAMIGDAFELTGPEGVITIEESPDLETSLNFQKGIVFERGYLHPQMITDEERQVVELNDPYILITDYKLSNPMEIVPILEMAKNAGRSLLIIADEIDSQVMGMLLVNIQINGMKIAAILSPMYGEGRKWRLEDLAVQTGGTYVSRDFGMAMMDVKEEMFGTARYVCVEKKQTTILDGGGDPEKIQAQQTMLRRMVEMTDYEFNKNRYKERLAKYVSGVAVIRVGGITETEMKERKLKIEDAYHASKSAIEEGIVPGGGTTLVDIQPPIKAYAASLTAEKQTGAAIVLHALEQPFLQLMENGGFNGPALLGKLKEQKRGIGYDMGSKSFRDMIQCGVIDPAKVVRLQIVTAISVVSTMLTTEAGVTEITKMDELSNR